MLTRILISRVKISDPTCTRQTQVRVRVYTDGGGGYAKTRRSMLPVVGVVIKWVNGWQDLADAHRTSIDARATICGGVCTSPNNDDDDLCSGCSEGDGVGRHLFAAAAKHVGPVSNRHGGRERRRGAVKRWRWRDS